MFSWIINLNNLFDNESIQETQSRKIAKIQQTEFNHQRQMAKTIDYENNTSNRPDVRLPDESLKGTQHPGP